MKNLSTLLLVVLSGAAAGGGGYWIGHRAAGKPAEADKPDAKQEEDKPVPTVSVISLRRKDLSEQVIAYGTVIAPASEVRVVSVPFESRVRKILVTPGQTVTEGQPLIEVEASAATLLALEEARNVAAAAQRDLELVKQRFDQKLATNSDLFTAENAVRTGQGRLNSLQQAGAGEPRELKAEAAGIVAKVDVQIGQVVPIGNPLVEVAALKQIEVKLGAEPQEAQALKAGQSVQLQPVDDTSGKSVTGTIRLIGQGVDPASRLVDVLVSLPEDAGFLLNSFVTGQMTIASDAALVVPRDAVLPDDGGYTLFTIKDGHAVKHAVKLGIEDDHQAQVIADDLKPGDPVVVVGNYELEDGMAVQTQPATTQPEATQPAATQPSASRANRFWQSSTFLPLPVLRERAGARASFCALRGEDPRPNPLPEYREREKNGAATATKRRAHSGAPYVDPYTAPRPSTGEGRP